MKKIFCFVAAALVSLSALAVDGVNVMASGLKATFNDDVTEMTIDYVLNTAATSLEVEFFDADKELVSLVELNDAALLTAGAHQTTIEIPADDLEEGVISWGIHAYGAATTFADVLPEGDNRYNYYLPMGVVVDNNFESEFFGRVYVCESTDGAGDGGSPATKAQVRGIYIYDTQMNFVNGQDTAYLGYDGGLAGARNSTSGFRRIAIDEAGYVYVASMDDATKGVYRMDPAHPENDFVTILSAANPVNAVEIVGNKMYTFENITTGSGEFKTYDLSTIPVAAATQSIPTVERTIGNAFVTIRSDKRGGFWVTQNRWALDAYKPFMHWNQSAATDFEMSLGVNEDLLGAVGNNVSYRGQLALNVAGDLLAIASNKCAKVYSVTYNDAGIPSLTFLCATPELGGNIDGLAFDAAENLYVASASVERFYVFPIAKENSNCRVLAASKYAFTFGDSETEEAVVYDVAQAIAAAEASTISENDSIIVRGVITKIEFKGTNFSRYGSANIYVADATGAEGSFEFYNCYSLLADTFRTSDPAYDATSSSWTQFQSVTDGNGVTVHVGDTVIAEGKYKKFNTTYELNTGCYLIDIKPFVEEAPERELTYFAVNLPTLNRPADNQIEMVGTFEEGAIDLEKLDNGWFIYHNNPPLLHAAAEETFKLRDKTNTDMVLCQKVGDNWVQAILTFGDDWEAEPDGYKGSGPCMWYEKDFTDANMYAWMEGMPEPEPEPTAVENVVVNTKAQKVMIDGVLYIVRDNKMYNVQGAELK